MTTWLWTFKPESELKDERTKKWNSDYWELMEHRRNLNHGVQNSALIVHWILGDDPIFIGIEN